MTASARRIQLTGENAAMVQSARQLLGRMEQLAAAATALTAEEVETLTSAALRLEAELHAAAAPPRLQRVEMTEGEARGILSLPAPARPDATPLSRLTKTIVGSGGQSFTVHESAAPGAQPPALDDEAVRSYNLTIARREEAERVLERADRVQELARQKSSAQLRALILSGADRIRVLLDEDPRSPEIASLEREGTIQCEALVQRVGIGAHSHSSNDHGMITAPALGAGPVRRLSRDEIPQE